MKKIIKILAAVLIPAALIAGVLFVMSAMEIDSIRSTEGTAKRTVTEGEVLEIGKEVVVLAESNGKRLSVDTDDLNFMVEDLTTGAVWSAIDPKGGDTEKSLLSINYVGDDNAFLVWDSYKYCYKNESYTLNRIENGVRIRMNFNEGASARFYEYMPQKMSVAHYDEVFVAGLERLVEEGTLEKTKATKYKNTLGLIYKKSKETESYNVNFVGQPPKSAVTQLIELAGLVGYTTEMLLQDAEEFGFIVEFKEPAIFDVVMDVTLENGELVVNLPVEEIKNGNTFFTLQNIEVLPNFGLVAAEKVTEGYLLLPDGAGALMKMNTYDPKVPDYVRGFYNNDYYTDYYYRAEYAQELMMPIFGSLMLAGEAEPYGFLGIVENGADTAFVETMAASGGEDGIGRKYNKIYTTYDVAQYEWVPVFGEYSDNKSTFLSIAPQTVEDYTLRYLFYTGEEVSYYRMAKDYQSYLCKDNVPGVYSDKAEILLETIGTLSLQERFLGIPYDTEYSMTTYAELKEILADLGDYHVNVVYKGMFDDGMNHKLMNKGKLAGTNGTKEELDSLVAAIEAKGDSIFLETDFLRIYKKNGNGFVKLLHGLEDYSRTVAEVYGYFTEIGWFTSRSNMYHLLDPQYLVDAVSDFKANTDGGYNYYTGTLTEQYYADYGTEYISPAEAQRLVDQALDILAKDNSSLALGNPRADKLQAGALAVDVSRESSALTSFYTSIPFRQLVMNGLMEYTTTAANNNSDPMHYFLMQAVETGAQPKFLISAKSVDVLKDSTYSNYFSVQYDLLKDEIKKTCAAYEEAMELIGTTEIKNHRMLAQDVFLTEYVNGTKVITNYTWDVFTYEGTEIAENDYLILKGGK